MRDTIASQPRLPGETTDNHVLPNNRSNPEESENNYSYVRGGLLIFYFNYFLQIFFPVFLLSVMKDLQDGSSCQGSWLI